jgi:protein-S-isoprenylcysteine O-methyltransferase Ste14
MLRRSLQVALTVLVWVGGLIAGAGTLHWTRGWLSVGLYLFAMTLAGVVIKRTNPELMAERAKWRRKDTKGFDKVFMALMLPLVMAQPAVAGLDAVRCRWSPLPRDLAGPGAAGFLLAMALICWTLAVNRHAETTVRIQTDRGHTVVTAGPYRVVRHPMYVGAIILYVSIPLVWGSGWALAVGAAIAGLFIWRTRMEDRTLQAELPGYREYAERTRYRLLPGIW